MIPARTLTTLALTGVAAWLSLGVIFALFGFNPGGSARKDLTWTLALASWAIGMVTLLGSGLYLARRPRRFRAWLVTLIVTGSSPAWLPIATLLLGETLR